MSNPQGSDRRRGTSVAAPGFLDDVLDHLPGVVYRCRNDAAWTMLGITANVRQLTGYSAEEIIGDGAPAFADLIHPDDRARVREMIGEAVATGTPFHVFYRLVEQGGAVRWVVEQGHGVDGGELVGYILELTAPLSERLGQQEGEMEALRSHTRDLELLQHVTGIINEEATLHEALRRTLPILCHDLGFALGHVSLPGEARTAPDPGAEREMWWFAPGDTEVEALVEALRSPSHGGAAPPCGLADRVRRSQGAVWVSDLATHDDFPCIRDLHPLPVTSGVAVPIRSGDHCVAVLECFSAERRDPDPGVESLLLQVGMQLGRAWEREEALRDREAGEARFRIIAHHMDDVFWTGTTGDSARDYASPAYARTWGRDPAELESDPRSWLEAVHPEDRERVEDVVRRRAGLGYEIQYRLLRPGGETRWIAERAIAVNDASTPVPRLVGVSEDVTERIRLEGQLRAAHRMEAVGRLAGGIAHDFNNLLTVIRAQTDFLLTDLAEGSPLIEEVEVVRSAADRAAELTRQLLAFSREQVLRPRVVDLVEVVRSMEQLLLRVLGEDVRIVTDFEPGLPPIRVDPSQLEQVLMNLAVNAREAMPDGGVLTVRARRETLTAEVARGRTELVVGAEYVRLDVHDTGQGMSETVRARIFEPFYTTKRALGGTGLGLAMAYGIVKQSGGTIHVNSAPGKGATFVLRFPPVSQPEAYDAAVDGVFEKERVAGAILVVEDDPAVRRTVEHTLRREGYVVEMATDAESGLAFLEKHADSIGCLLTDLVLPGMSGRRLLAEVERRHPHIRCVAMSGYAEGSPDRRVDLPVEVAFVQKPFTAESLLRALGHAPA